MERIPAYALRAGDSTERLPKLGDSVWVEELPSVITMVKPVYPNGARSADLEGNVVVQALVGRDGRVKDVRIKESSNRAFNRSAMNAVRKWVFKPAMAGGKPIAVWVAAPINFKLSD